MEHQDLVLLFLRSQVEQFDYFHKKAEKYSVNAGTVSEGPINHAKGSRHTVTITTAGTNHVIILGAKQKACDIQKLLTDQKADLAFKSFCSRVSIAIQALSPEDEIAINNAHQVRSSIFINVIIYDLHHRLCPDHRISVCQGEIRING